MAPEGGLFSKEKSITLALKFFIISHKNETFQKYSMAWLWPFLYFEDPKKETPGAIGYFIVTS